MRTISISNYLKISVSIVMLVISLVGYEYYNSQRKRVAELVFNDIHFILTAQSFKLSKTLRSYDDILKLSAEIKRVAVNTNIIKAFIVANKDKVIFTTNLDFNKIPEYGISLKSTRKLTLTDLDNIEYYGQKFHFYDYAGVEQELFLYLVIDRKHSVDLINEPFYRSSILLLFLLLNVFFVGWVSNIYMIIRPMEKLRKYAYYQTEVPDKMHIQELEYVRSSMEKTFCRLEKEKKELYDLARTDQLSGLHNRNALTERVNWLISECTRDNTEFAFLFLDLDHFKEVNDALGHDAGDALLVQIAEYINSIVREDDITARIGGDEFVIVIRNYISLIDLTHTIERILNYVKEPFKLLGNEVNISCSIGIALFPKDGTNLTELLKNSDIALYESKNTGRNRFNFFTKELNDSMINNMKLEQEIKSALNNNEFELHYQPKIDLSTNKIIGAEALIRWNHPTKGLLYPNSFIPGCELNGLIVHVGEWVLNEIIQQQVTWKNEGVADIILSANVAPIQFKDKNFKDNLYCAIDALGIHPSKLDLEITEGLFLEHTESNLKLLLELHETGISLSLDDFGTGYSSLSYLKQFPIDFIKIDKSFLDDYESDSGKVFIETIITMGHTLGKYVIAEGVETEDQIEYLKSVGCDHYQGYYYNKPMKVDQFEKLLLKYVP